MVNYTILPLIPGLKTQLPGILAYYTWYLYLMLPSYSLPVNGMPNTRRAIRKRNG